MNNTHKSGVHTFPVCNLFVPFVLFLIIATLAACKKQDPIPTPIERQLIAESVLEGYSVRLYSDASKLSTGYNKLYLSVEKKEGESLRDTQHLRVTPIMDMHDMSHSCPFIEPIFREDIGLFEAAAVFTMPSG